MGLNDIFKVALGEDVTKVCNELETYLYWMQGKKKLEFLFYQEMLELSLEFFTQIDSGFIDETLQEELNDIEKLKRYYFGINEFSILKADDLFKERYFDERYHKIYANYNAYMNKLQAGQKSLQNMKHPRFKHLRKNLYEKLTSIKQKCYENKDALLKYHKKVAKVSHEYQKIASMIAKSSLDALNGHTYSFLKAMFERANASSKVKYYFQKNGFDLPIDERVFLKHFLEVTTIEVQDQRYKKLLGLFQEYKNQKRKSLAIIHDEMEVVERLKATLEHSKKDLIVKGYISYQQFLQERPETDLIMIDYNLDGLSDDLPVIKQSYKSSDFVLLCQDLENENFTPAIQAGVYNPIARNHILKEIYLDGSKFSKKVEQFL